MISLKTLKRKYKVQILLAYIPLIATLVISFSKVLPVYLIDYKWPLILILLLVPLLYSYNLLLKNHIEDLNIENQALNKKLLEQTTIERKSLISSGDYQFDSKFGFYKNKQTGELFCSPCLLKEIPAQLKEFDDYWRCINCGKWYYKEHYKPPPKPSKGINPITDF